MNPILKHNSEQTAALNDIKCLNIRQLDESQRFLLKHFCKQHKQAMPQGEEVALVLLEKQQLLGLVKLQRFDEDQHFWLRGLFIHPSFRNRGLARQLMNAAHSEIINKYANFRSITLFALQHLQSFYASLNYRPVDALQIPQELQYQWQKAETEGKNWQLMQWQNSQNR